MGERTSFYKIDRKTLYDDQWTSEPFDRFHAWCDLIGRANYTNSKAFSGAEVITIKRGQVLTSVFSCSNRWHWSREKTKNFLDALESMNSISRKRYKNATVITIENYDYYQGFYNDSDNESYNAPDIEPCNSPATNLTTDRQQNIQLTDNSPTHQKKENKENKENKEKKVNKSERDIERNPGYGSLPPGMKTLGSVFAAHPLEQKPSSSLFSSPSLEEVKAYVKEKGYRFKAEKFYALYQGKGWPRYWRAIADYWEQTEDDHLRATGRELDFIFDSFKEDKSID